jgi:hypothetical protein
MGKNSSRKCGYVLKAPTISGENGEESGVLTMNANCSARVSMWLLVKILSPFIGYIPRLSSYLN